MGCPGQVFWAEAITTCQPGCCFWGTGGEEVAAPRAKGNDAPRKSRYIVMILDGYPVF